MDQKVISCVPYYRCQRYVRRAVESLLAQTHRDLTVVVVNDADFETPPWPALADITDPRLIRFDLPRNRGPYFANAVVHAAADTPYFLVHDADDWSHPRRVERLMKSAIEQNADFVFSTQVDQDENGQIVGSRWGRTPSPTRPDFFFQPNLTGEFINRLCHHGLFRRTALAMVGGYYGGMRMNYDVFLMNLLLMVGRVCHVDEPLYYYNIRPDSLSRSNETGNKSEERKQVRQKLAQLYETAYASYQGFALGRITAAEMLTTLRAQGAHHITPEAKAALAREALQLSEILRSMLGQGVPTG